MPEPSPNHTEAPALSVIIPAYNEARRLGHTLHGIRDYVAEKGVRWEIVVVDDGSGDGTGAIVSGGTWEPLDVRLLTNERNCGKGHAVRRGMLAASGNVLLMCDADMSTPIAEVEKLLPWLEQGYDVVIGSRDMPDSVLDPPQPMLRRLMAWLFRAVRRRRLVPEIRDTQCGFKCFSRAAAREVFGRQTIDGFTFDCEVLGLADRLGYRIKEVGVVWQNHPESRVNPWRQALAVLSDLRAIRRRIERVEIATREASQPDTDSHS